MKKFLFRISFVAICAITTGLVFKNLNSSNNLNGNFQINGESLKLPSDSNDSIYYSGINSLDYKAKNNLNTYYIWKITNLRGFRTNITNSPTVSGMNYQFGDLSSPYIIDSFLTVSSNIQLTETSYSESFIQENIILPVNPKDWTNQKYTIDTNWTGGFLSFGKTSYTITALGGQQVFTIEDSNVDDSNGFTCFKKFYMILYFF